MRAHSSVNVYSVRGLIDDYFLGMMFAVLVLHDHEVTTCYARHADLRLSAEECTGLIEMSGVIVESV